MNEYIDLTDKGDFLHRYRPRLLFNSIEFEPWHNMECKYGDRYIDYDTRPWIRIDWKDAEGVLCDCCGEKLDNDLPWQRKLYLCNQCYKELTLQCADDRTPQEYLWYNDSGMESKYTDIFLTEFMDIRRNQNS